MTWSSSVYARGPKYGRLGNYSYHYDLRFPFNVNISPLLQSVLLQYMCNVLARIFYKLNNHMYLI